MNNQVQHYDWFRSVQCVSSCGKPKRVLFWRLFKILPQLNVFYIYIYIYKHILLFFMLFAFVSEEVLLLPRPHFQIGIIKRSSYLMV